MSYKLTSHYAGINIAVNGYYINSTIYIDGYRGSFCNLHLINCDIPHFLVEKTIVKDCIFNNCTFDNVVMDKQGFYNCNFKDSVFNNLRASRFGDEKSNIIKCDFENTIWKNVNFYSGQPIGKFRNCSFYDAFLNNTNFGYCKFLFCNFNKANMENCIIGSPLFCSFHGTNIKNMTVNGFVFPYTYIKLWYGGANLSNVHFFK